MVEIYIVTFFNYDGNTEIRDVFLSRESAEEYVAEHRDKIGAIL